MMDAMDEIFCVDVRFETLIYPCEETWRGRRKVESVDLSSSGMTFYCEQKLVRGEEIEVVIPVTTQPLLIRAQILTASQEMERTLYAVKFIELCREEEKLLSEAVFAIQLRQHRRNKSGRKGAQS